MLFYLQISVALPFSWRICSVYVVYNPEPSKPQTIANVRDWNRPKLLEASDLFWHAFEMGGSTWWQIIYIYIYIDPCCMMFPKISLWKKAISYRYIPLINPSYPTFFSQLSYRLGFVRTLWSLCVVKRRYYVCDFGHIALGQMSSGSQEGDLRRLAVSNPPKKRKVKSCKAVIRMSYGSIFWWTSPSFKVSQVLDGVG